MFYRGLHGRVTKLETDVAAIGTDVKDVQTVVGGLGGKIDKLVDGLSSTDGRAAERAQAVKVEMRDEHDRPRLNHNRQVRTVDYTLLSGSDHLRPR